MENNGGLGIQTAALSYGGYPAPFAALTLEYDGSAWTASNSLNTPRSGSVGGGTQTAGLSFTGQPDFSAGASATESYNGTSWTTLASVNTARADAGGGGSQTIAVVFGGKSDASTNTQATETWDGSSWATSPATLANTSTMAVAAANQPGSGVANISMGGAGAPASPQVTTTEEFTGAAVEIQTVTAS